MQMNLFKPRYNLLILRRKKINRMAKLIQSVPRCSLCVQIYKYSGQRAKSRAYNRMKGNVCF